ncbi:hypothetical protein niasHS_008732 [Heterodera schachtii]|uniref:Uncharacterized protein n=1 Tax=Heterodera schachtii TaxID=97005 RepID=A0ABD2J6Q9_HETSC
MGAPLADAKIGKTSDNTDQPISDIGNKMVLSLRIRKEAIMIRVVLSLKKFVIRLRAVELVSQPISKTNSSRNTERNILRIDRSATAKTLELKR